ncbi:ATP-binding protein [Patescibacteria group bacterium]|nr:ATP-binding protein [Patescibacteria group bacterium]
MLIERILTSKVQKAMQSGKVTILYGPRQVGKTTLLSQLSKELDEPYLQINGDQLKYREVLSSENSQRLKELIGDNKIIIIDEAQRVPNIGLNLKIVVDNFPEVKVLITGSATLDLASKISEPLTGRKKVFMLYPVSYQEIEKWQGSFEARQQLERWLVFGTYPEALMIESRKQRENYLAEIVSSYLYKEVLDFGGIRKSDKIVDLLRLLAFQIGHEVAISELASNLALDRVTVEKYLDLLEKVFVIYKIGGFSRNLRKEIAKTDRYYFYDNGVRNALIENFNDLKLRNDKGQLWENFLFTERLKLNQNLDRRANYYFWRTYDQKEIDLIEEREGKIYGFEFKWQGEIRPTVKKEFTQAYTGAQVETINQTNFTKFTKRG